MISEEQVTEFQKVHREQFGKDISREKAYEDLIKLVRFVETVAKYMPAQERQSEQNKFALNNNYHGGMSVTPFSDSICDK